MCSIKRTKDYHGQPIIWKDALLVFLESCFMPSSSLKQETSLIQVVLCLFKEDNIGILNNVL
uniref:Uncharacterized protein n=1 Tax=Lepeophtheirus salmonis TaxID=72036 RepID=A0A0K2TR62_LEPSM